jgi:hypothetical protein
LLWAQTVGLLMFMSQLLRSCSVFFCIPSCGGRRQAHTNRLGLGSFFSFVPARYLSLSYNPMNDWLCAPSGTMRCNELVVCTKLGRSRIWLQDGPNQIGLIDSLEAFVLPSLSFSSSGGRGYRGRGGQEQWRSQDQKLVMSSFKIS